MKYREDFNYPPFTDICIILYKNEIEEKLFKKTNSLYQEIMFLLEKY
jgi:primosomal protein N'